MFKKLNIKILIILISIIIICVYVLISSIIENNKFENLNLELLKKQEGSEIVLKKSIVKLSNNKKLKKYNLTSGFYAGIHEDFPGSGYIDFYEGNIIVISSRGVLAFKKKS